MFFVKDDTLDWVCRFSCFSNINVEKLARGYWIPHMHALFVIAHKNSRYIYNTNKGVVRIFKENFSNPLRTYFCTGWKKTSFIEDIFV